MKAYNLNEVQGTLRPYYSFTGTVDGLNRRLSAITFMESKLRAKSPHLLGTLIALNVIAVILLVS